MVWRHQLWRLEGHRKCTCTWSFAGVSFWHRDGFHFFNSIFGKSFFDLMDAALLRKPQTTPLHCDSLCVCVCVCIHVWLFAFAGLRQHVGTRVFTHCISPRLLNSPQVHSCFSHIDHFAPVKCPTLFVSDCFTGCCCTECYPIPPLLPSARIKFRKKIIFMRVRGVGINGWIIFRKRRSSSLRWAVSHSNVLVITQHIMPGKDCSPAAAHMPSTGWTRTRACDCVCLCQHVCVYVHMYKRLCTVLYLRTFALFASPQHVCW